MDNATNSTNSTGNGTFEGFQSTAAPKSFWGGLLLPVLYLTILIGSLYTFSSVYRKRQLAKAAKLEGWFPPHRQRDIYLSLLHIDPQEASAAAGGEKKLSQVPDSVLKAALLRRAVEDIQRIVQLRGAKPPLQNLVQRGSVGDELWQRFQRAEKEMEEEVKDVVNEVGDHHAGRPASVLEANFGIRRTLSRPTGVKLYSNQPTRSTKTVSSRNASRSCNPLSKPRRSGGQRRRRASRRTS